MQNKRKSAEVPEGNGIETNLCHTRPDSEEELPASATEAVERTLQGVWKKLNSDALKPSVADLIRLLQLRMELKESSPRNVIAKWVDEWNTPPGE